MRGSGIPRRHPGEIYIDINLVVHKFLSHERKFTCQTVKVNIVVMCTVTDFVIVRTMAPYPVVIPRAPIAVNVIQGYLIVVLHGVTISSWPTLIVFVSHLSADCPSWVASIEVSSIITDCTSVIEDENFVTWSRDCRAIGVDQLESCFCKKKSNQTRTVNISFWIIFGYILSMSFAPTPWSWKIVHSAW